MSFPIREFQPMSVSDERSDTPPPGLIPDAQLILGIELFISGLNHTGPRSAEENLNQIIQNLAAASQPLPDLNVVSPNSINVDYVYVSLKDTCLHQNPQPDVLETIRDILDQQQGVCAHWRMAKSADKARQLFFVTDSKSEATLLKPRLDTIFQAEHYNVQSVWISDAGWITYHFHLTTAIDNLMHTYLIVDGHSCIPRRPRFVQPIFGLEIAINGVGDYPQAHTLINHYIQDTYGPQFGSDVVRRSHIMLDRNVYCTVLKNPAVTCLLLSEEFNLFKNKPRFTSSVPTWQPNYLYNLNIQGFPTTTLSF